MLKGKVQIVFRIVIGLVFLGVGVKNFIDGELILGGISLLAGIAFIASLFIKKNGEKK